MSVHLANDNGRDKTAIALALRNRFVAAQIVGLALTEVAIFAIKDGKRSRGFAGRLENACEAIQTTYERLPEMFPQSADVADIMGEVSLTLEQTMTMLIELAHG